MSGRVAFFYGTLMAPEVLHRVISGLISTPSSRTSNLEIHPALLPNHTRHRVRQADYPGVIPDSGGSVRGTYVSGLTDNDILRLDMFEGEEYTRKWVEVEVLVDEEVDESGLSKKQKEEESPTSTTPASAEKAGQRTAGEEGQGRKEIRAAETYIYTYGDEHLEKLEWDYEQFRKEKLHNWAGPASKEYAFEGWSRLDLNLESDSGVGGKEGRSGSVCEVNG